MSGDPVLRVIAFLLPRAARARYLEEWRSDSQATAEAGLRRRDVLLGAAMLTLWAVFWGGLAAVVVTFAAQRSQMWMTPRRVSILLLTIVGGAVFFRFFAGFSIGMSIADTWVTSGVGTSIASAVLPYAGQLALAAAVVLSGWAPKIYQSRVPVA